MSLSFDSARLPNPDLTEEHDDLFTIDVKKTKIQFPEDFEVYDPKISDRIFEGGRKRSIKTFEYLLIQLILSTPLSNFLDYLINVISRIEGRERQNFDNLNYNLFLSALALNLIGLFFRAKKAYPF